jgi:glycosyltransferase involved in cell wall biosynthesis
MKICQVIYNLECGGAEVLAMGLAREFALGGHTVEVIRLNEASGSSYEAMAIKSFDEVGITTCSLDRKHGTAGLMSVAKLWREFQAKQFDLVHSHLSLPDAFTGLVKRFSFTSFDHVMTVHNTNEVRNGIIRLLPGRPTVVYCSRASENRNQVNHHRSVVIPNGIPVAKYRYSEPSRIRLRAALGLPDSAFVVISVGNLRGQKNHDCAVRGIAQDRKLLADADIHYLICGEGGAIETLNLKNRISELGLTDRVHLLGARTDIPELLSAADLFLSTSLHEGMPLAVLQAFAASLPCLLSPLEEHREIKEGMPVVELLAAIAPEAVAEGLRTAIMSLPSRNELSIARAPALERFEMSHCAARYLDLYQDLRSLRFEGSKCLSAANGSGFKNLLP